MVLASYALAHEGLVLAREAQDAWNRRPPSEWLAAVPEGLRHLLPVAATGDMVGGILAALPEVSSLVPQAVSAGASLVLDLFILTVSVYYFFLDGRRLFQEGVRLLPLDPRYPEAFAHEFREVAYALVYGNALTGLLQGAVGWLGLWMAGIPHAHVWAVGIVLAAFVPLGGTALLWAPLGLFLVLTGRPEQGWFLIGWGALAVSTVDNLARPILCGARLAVHPLLVSLSIFGGLAVLGVSGLLIGPLVAALVMAMVRIYRRDFLKLPVAQVPAPSYESAPTLISLGVSMDAVAPPK
jgi:predicted PurR-regulated permease PerM